MLDKLGLRRKSLIERWADHLRGVVEDAAEEVERSTARAAELAGEAGRRGGAYLRGAGERARKAGARARQAREEVWETGERIGRRARTSARERGEAVADRVQSIARRAAEIRAARRRRRGDAERAVERTRPEPRREPMRLDVRSDDRVVLRGRRSIDVRLPDGGTVRYRYYERPGFWRRLKLNLTGRRVWPR